MDTSRNSAREALSFKLVLDDVYSELGEALGLLGDVKEKLHESPGVEKGPEAEELVLIRLAAAEAPLRCEISTLTGQLAEKTLECNGLTARVAALQEQLAPHSVPPKHSARKITFEDLNPTRKIGVLNKDFKRRQDLSFYKGLVGSKNVAAPPMRTLRPCFPKANVDISTKLSPEASALLGKTKALYFYNRAFRRPDEQQCAVLIPKGQTEDFSQWSGQICEFFFNDRSSIFYAGTYKCHKIRDFPTSLVGYISNVMKRGIIMAENGGSFLNLMQDFERYSSGTDQLTYLGMERIGFNDALYKLLACDTPNLLLLSCPPQGFKLKRKADENAPPPGVRPVEKKVKLWNHHF